MADSETTLLGLLLMETDSHDNDWGEQANDNVISPLDDAVTATDTHSVTGGTTTYTTKAEVRKPIHRVTGTLVSNQIFIVPATAKYYFWQNATSGAFTVTVKVSGQTGVVVPQGEIRLLRCNGTDVVDTGLVSTGAQSGLANWVGSLAFSADAYSAPANNYIGATPFTGMRVRGKIANANATTTPTFNYAAGGAATIVREDRSALSIGELAVNMIVDFTHDATGPRWYVSLPKPPADFGTVTGALTLSGIVTATVGADPNNDYAPTGFATASTYYLSSAAPRTITGLDGGADGRIKVIHNNNAVDTITFLDANAGSGGTPSGANRFLMGGDLVLGPRRSAIFQHLSGRWRLLATADLNSGMGEEYIGTYTVSAAASLNVTDLSGFVIIKGIYTILPATDGAELYLRLSANNGSSYITTSYQSKDAGGSLSTVVSGIVLGGASAGSGDISSAVGESGISGTFEIYNFNAAKTQLANCEGAYTRVDGDVGRATFSGFQTTGNAKDALRLIADSGNITGTLRLMGIRG